MADETNDPVVDPVAAAVRRLEARGQREDAAVVAAAQERARPASELARAALPVFAAFERAHGAGLRERMAILATPVLGQVATITVVLAEARAYGAEVIALLELPTAIHTYLDELARLTPQDLAHETFAPSRLAFVIDQLTHAAGGAEVLPDKLRWFEAKWAQLKPRLANVPELLPVPRGDVGDHEPREEKRYATGSLRRDA
jgi:hypothetical protein